MAKRTTCLHCGAALTASQQKRRNTYCHAQCAYNHRGTLRAERGHVPRATHQHNLAAHHAWLAERRRRLARQQRQDAA